METTRGAISPEPSGPAQEVQIAVEGIARELAFDSPEAMAAIQRATRRFSANCVNLEEIDAIDDLSEARLDHVWNCEFCTPLMKALKTAPPMRAVEFATIASPHDARCPDCGARIGDSGAFQLLGRLGINEEMVTSLKSSITDVDVEEHLAIAREYLRSSTSKAAGYAKENPGKVAAGIAVVAIGAGMLISALRNQE
ncbi:MAG: hypothetical protein AABO58_13915 [Acidobacteriota bacterium]